MIGKAVREEINAVGFEYPDLIPYLRRVKSAIAGGVGPRITDDIGRVRRLVQLCKSKGRK